VRLIVETRGDPVALMEADIDAAERAVTTGIREAGVELQRAWRGQITGAGLGERLARTIRLNVYPRAGQSIGAAALVFSRASELVDVFDQGVTIRSKHGFYLAIPTAAAGAKGAGGKRITPGGWERRTGMRLRFVYRRYRPSLLVADDARLTIRGRAAVKGGRRRRDGMLTGAQTIPIFILVPQVKLRKRLDLDRAANAAQARLPMLILARWQEQ
jgi:hypothetical protein